MNLHVSTVSPAARVVRAVASGVLVTLLAACSTAPKSLYPGAEAAQQQQAAVTTAESTGPDGATAAAVDTRATYLSLIARMQREGLWFASLAHIDAMERRWAVAPESQRLRADALRQTGQAPASEAAYRKLIGTPLEAAGYHGLGLLAGMRGDFADAARQLQLAQQRTPTDALLLSDLGYALMRAGQIEQARVPLMQAAQLQADNAQAHSNLALYFEASHQSDKATALMDARRMPADARAAIREAARRLNGGAAPATGVAAASDVGSTASRTAVSALADGGPPLVLQTATWPGMRGAHTAAPAQPPSPTATASPPLSSGDTL